MKILILKRKDISLPTSLELMFIVWFEYTEVETGGSHVKGNN